MDLDLIFQGKITPEKWRMLGDYLKGDKFHFGKGIKLENSGTAGKAVSLIPQNKIKPTQAPPFSILSLRKVPDSNPVEYQANLQEGWVITRATQSTADGVQEDEPTIGGVLMSTRPRPDLSLSDGDFIACQFDTNSEGFLTTVPAIVTSQTEVDSTHHQPPSGAGSGADGSYWVKLAKFDLVDGAPQITYYQQSDIEHTRLPTFRNVGGARYIHKEWDGEADRYDFRTLEQTDIPALRAGGKVIVDADPADEFDDANDSIKFATVLERLEDPQVRVTDSGSGQITVEGNGRDGSLIWEDCEGSQTTMMEWTDGLVITPVGGTIIAGCGDYLPSGSSGDILYHNGTNWVVLPNPGASALEYWVLTHNGTAPTWVDSDGV